MFVVYSAVALDVDVCSVDKVDVLGRRVDILTKYASFDPGREMDRRRTSLLYLGRWTANSDRRGVFLNIPW